MSPVRTLQASIGMYEVTTEVEITGFSVKKQRFGVLTG